MFASRPSGRKIRVLSSQKKFPITFGVIEKELVGVMEHIRVKFGQDKPSALLSRSVAGVAGRTQIYALPGSVKAVSEYLGEIFKTLEHAVYMLHSLDVH